MAFYMITIKGRHPVTEEGCNAVDAACKALNKAGLRYAEATFTATPVEPGVAALGAHAMYVEGGTYRGPCEPQEACSEWSWIA